MRRKSQSLCYASIIAPLIDQKVVTHGKFQQLCAWAAKDFPQVTELSSISSINSANAEALVKFAKQHAMELSGKPKSGETVLIGIFNLDSVWRNPGKAIKHTIKGKTYPYVAMDDFSLHSVAGFNEAFCIKTKDNYRVWMGVPYTTIALDELGRVKSKKQLGSWTQLQFPMVDFREQIELSKLRGMELNNQPVIKAEQLNLIKLNEKRIQVKSETVMRTKGIKRESVVFIIEDPFYLWITHRKTGNLPLLTAYIDQKYWTRPKEA